MNPSMPLRISLVVLIVASIAAIAGNLWYRKQETIEIPVTEILSPEVSRRSTKFEYTEHKRGRRVFQVEAETSIETVDSVHTLNDVRLSYFDGADEPSDTISGRRAIYRIQEKQIEFLGDAQIQLADGMEVFSQHVKADLEREIVTISQGFRFQKGQIQGSGRSLLYPIRQPEIQVREGLQLMIPSGSSQVTARTLQAIYRVSDQTIDLIGKASIGDPGMDLAGDQIAVFLSQDHRLKEVRSSGNARLQAGSSRSFSGQAINLFFDPHSRRAKYFEILADRAPGSSATALFKGTFRRLPTSLRAQRIRAVPQLIGQTDSLSLESFQAWGSVSLTAPAMGIKEANADRLEGFFYEDGEHLKKLQLAGNVSVRRQQGVASAPVEEDLRCRELILQLAAGEVLEHAQAIGSVRLLISGGQTRRRLAGNSVEIDYADGFPERVVSRGECQVESHATGQRTVLRAPLLEMRYRRGRPESMTAGGGVDLEFVDQDAVRRTTSKQLNVTYRNDEMERVVQSGDFHLREGNPATADVESDEAVFDPRRQVISMSGGKPALLTVHDSGGGSALKTEARQLELETETGKLLALGQVRSLIPAAGGATIITAGEMSSDPNSGWVVYSQSPRIVQQANTITGNTVRYNSGDQQLVVEENVESFLYQGSKTDPKRYRVVAEHLDYSGGESRARYEGSVRVSAEGLMVVAPFVDFVFDNTDTNQVDHILAWGGVRINEENRRAEGSRALHYPDQQKVILSGDPAHVSELGKSKVVGRRLTFYLADERLFVENTLNPQEP